MIDYVYITGTSYSGSTLLSFLLNAQPQLVSVGEATGPIPGRFPPSSRACSCGAPLGECSFWHQVGNAMRSRGFDFDVGRWNTGFELGLPPVLSRPLLASLRRNQLDRARDAIVERSPVLGRQLRETGRRNVAFASSITSIAGKPTFVDASKDPRRVALLMRYTVFRPFVVHLVRDALGYVSSNVKRKRQTLDGAVRSWLVIADHVERLRTVVDRERWQLLRYEDLCKDPAAEISHLARSMGLTLTTPELSFRDADHHIVGNRMRIRDTSEIVPDESWREQLDEREVQEILSRTRHYRQRLGYAENP